MTFYFATGIPIPSNLNSKNCKFCKAVSIIHRLGAFTHSKTLCSVNRQTFLKFSQSHVDKRHEKRSTA